MKKLIVILTSLIGLNSALAKDIQYDCDRPTKEHSELLIVLDSNTSMATILTDNTNLHLYATQVEKSIREQLGQSLLKEPIIMIGTTAKTEVLTGYSAYTKSISVVLMQKIPGQAGTLTAYLTENNTVSIYSCDLKK